MKKTKSEIAYELLCRFEGLINSIKPLETNFPKGFTIRMKPLFISYNSCIEAFRHSFPKEYCLLNLESLPLEDSSGNKLFATDKLSTLLHQSETVFAQLKGLSPYEFKAKPTSARESLAWYWHNTHSQVIIYFIILLFIFFGAGTISSETTLYKNIIRPLVSEYISFKPNAQKNTTVPVPPAQNNNRK
jgi:hypothetical protein